jgi:hypothetical protein
MFILSIDLHSSQSTIRLSFHFQDVTYESLDHIYCSKFSTGCNPHVLGWFSHHTRQPNWWSVHQRRLATSCCPPFRQPSISYKACVYGWQCQASSFKSSNRLSPTRSRDFCSLASLPVAMLPPTDECFAQEVPEHVYDGLTCPKYALWDSNPGSSSMAQLAKE